MKLQETDGEKNHHPVCHSPCLWEFFWGLFSLLYALKRSIPRKTLRKFIPAMPKRARGSSTPFPNLEASLINLTVMRTWEMNLARVKVTQLRTHSAFTILLSAPRTPAIRRTFLMWRKIECSCKITRIEALKLKKKKTDIMYQRHESEIESSFMGLSGVPCKGVR